MMIVTMSKVTNLVTAAEHLGKLWRWCGRGAGGAELDKLVSQSTQASQDSLHFSTITQNWRTQLQIYFMLSKSYFPKSSLSLLTFLLNVICQNIGSFNCQGLATSMAKRRMIADDFEKYNLTALMLQETHLKGYGVLTIKSSSNKEYMLYYSGNAEKSDCGVGIAVPSNRKVTFSPIN